MAGRPKPTALKVLAGTARRDRLNPDEPRPALGAKPPPWLPRRGAARDAWNRLAPVLLEMRVLTAADAEALALGCAALADWLEAPVDEWRRRDAAWRQCMLVLRDFGMTPSSRARVGAMPAPAADPVAEWAARDP